MTQPEISDTHDTRWAGFSAAEISEIALGLDRRLTAAEEGNAYVWWDVVVKLLRELTELDGSTFADKAEYLRELGEREQRARAATP